MNFNDIKGMSTEEAISWLNVYLGENPEDDEAYTERGLKYWSQNKRKEAINDYLKALQLNPASRAAMALEYANSILDYYNKDLYNP